MNQNRGCSTTAISPPRIGFSHRRDTEDAEVLWFFHRKVRKGRKVFVFFTAETPRTQRFFLVLLTAKYAKFFVYYRGDAEDAEVLSSFLNDLGITEITDGTGH